MRATFNVDYNVIQNGVVHRQRRIVTQSQLAGNADSEFAVVEFLRRSHPGCHVEINSLTRLLG